MGEGWIVRWRVAAGTLRHVGLAESVAMIAGGLGWQLDEITTSIEPIVAKARVKTNFVTVEAGQIAGVRQVGRGIRAEKELITSRTQPKHKVLLRCSVAPGIALPPVDLLGLTKAR